MNNKELVSKLELRGLNDFEIKKYNGGGPIRDIISYFAGALSVDWTEKIKMTPKERAAFIREHGLRD